MSGDCSRLGGGFMGALTWLLRVGMRGGDQMNGQGS